MQEDGKQSAQKKYDVSDQLVRETKAMIAFALSRGKKISPNVILTLEQVEGRKPTPVQIRLLTLQHNQLVALIKPALPRNVVYIAEQEAKYATRKNIFTSKFPMLRKLFVFSLLSTLALIVSSLSDKVSTVELSKGVLHSSGWILLANFVFLSAAAAIGASFLVLSNIRNKFTDGSYHPDQNSSYWVTILLGIIGGIIMSEFVSVHPSQVENMSAAADSTYVNNKMLFALLGGFSSKLVYNVLNKLIVAAESIVSGGAQAKAEAESEMIRNEAEAQLSRTQMNYGSQLAAMKARIQQLKDPDEIKGEVNTTIDTMFEDLGVDAGRDVESSIQG